MNLFWKFGKGVGRTWKAFQRELLQAKLAGRAKLVSIFIYGPAIYCSLMKKSLLDRVTPETKLFPPMAMHMHSSVGLGLAITSK